MPSDPSPSTLSPPQQIVGEMIAADYQPRRFLPVGDDRIVFMVAVPRSTTYHPGAVVLSRSGAEDRA